MHGLYILTYDIVEVHNAVFHEVNAWGLTLLPVSSPAGNESALCDMPV